MAKSVAEKQLPATATEETLPDYLKDYQGAGRGISDAREDNLVPLVTVLHALSPQVNPRNPQYIEGATPGKIWLRNAPLDKPLLDDFLWQQCYYEKNWIEWIPREHGGGFVNRWADVGDKPDCPDAVKHPHDAYKWLHGDNELIETRNLVGYVLLPSGPLPYVIPFKGAGHAQARAFMTVIPRTLPNGARADSWMFKWLFGSEFMKNAKGEWYAIKAKKRVGFVDEKQAELGLQLYESFVRGEKRAEADEDIIAQPDPDAL